MGTQELGPEFELEHPPHAAQCPRPPPPLGARALVCCQTIVFARPEPGPTGISLVRRDLRVHTVTGRHTGGQLSQRRVHLAGAGLRPSRAPIMQGARGADELRGRAPKSYTYISIRYQVEYKIRLHLCNVLSG